MATINRKIAAAIATPPGEGGIAVIRVTGQGSIELVNGLFKGKDLTIQKGYTLHHGTFCDLNNLPVDDVLISVFKSPHSYTGEDTIEINCHGGVVVTRKILETVLIAGAHPAEPGEFTLRAFMNGKIELSQAEAVADLIHAKSFRAAKAAKQQLDGELGNRIRHFRQQIIDAAALIELELDFVEEDVEFADKDGLRQLLEALEIEIGKLLETYENGRLIKDGVKTVLFGRPNAGKSTLLNALSQTDRAIVTEIAGTTRDTLDIDWNYEGMLFKLIDTAGVRHTQDRIEAIGVERSHKALEQADVVLYLKDLSTPLQTDEEAEIAETRKKNPGAKHLLIGTKKDLLPNSFSCTNPYHACISTIDEMSISALKKLVKETALENKNPEESGLLITTERHRDALKKTLLHVQSAIAGLKQNKTGDLLSIDLRVALRELGSITGEITTEDLLDSIFSRFCIGK